MLSPSCAAKAPRRAVVQMVSEVEESTYWTPAQTYFKQDRPASGARYRLLGRCAGTLGLLFRGTGRNKAGTPSRRNMFEIEQGTIPVEGKFSLGGTGARRLARKYHRVPGRTREFIEVRVTLERTNRVSAWWQGCPFYYKRI